MKGQGALSRVKGEVRKEGVGKKGKKEANKREEGCLSFLFLR